MFNASKSLGPRFAVSLVAVAGLLVLWLCAMAPAAKEPTVDELKARLASAGVGDRPRLCIEIAERQLSAANKLYADGESEKAQAALSDVVAFSESARDNAIQSHKHLKQTEIAARTMTRKLNDLKHAVTHDEQSAVQDAMDRLQRVRDDLLAAMFPKGQK